jgi:S1-C subfamily serine protease
MNDDQLHPTPQGPDVVDPDAATGPGIGGGDPLEDTQPLDVPRYAPTPDPRPDARWAWASPGSTGSGERWYEPGSPGRVGSTPPPPAYAAGPLPAPAYAPGSAPGATPTAAPARARGRGGAGAGTVVAAALLSAAVASGGTVLILDRVGALDRTVVQAGPAQGTATGNPLPVTIDESSAVIDVAAKVSPAVVKITVAGEGTDPFSGIPNQGVGSGVIYDPAGWILTNRHVVSGAEALTVELKDGRTFDGRVYGIDTLTDLAIVKVDQTGLPAAAIGQSDGLKIGQLVVAIGSPLGTYSFSVTSGIVSGKGRTIQVDDGTRINNLIQTDAAINPGNSGGPLADATGAVVGVNTAVATESAGIGFAIPIDIARPIMEQAVAGKALARPWIGIRFESIDLQVKQQRSLPVGAGALVSSNGGEPAVMNNSPAAEAGVREGDIIVSLNGKPIDAEHPLDALLVQFSPGETIRLDVLRDGASIQLDVTLGTRPTNL